jgi:hypothetical protein
MRHANLYLYIHPNTSLCRLFNMSILSSSGSLPRVAFDNNRNAQYPRPNELELVLSAVQTMAQPDAPDNVAVL